MKSKTKTNLISGQRVVMLKPKRWANHAIDILWHKLSGLTAPLAKLLLLLHRLFRTGEAFSSSAEHQQLSFSLSSYWILI